MPGRLLVRKTIQFESCMTWDELSLFENAIKEVQHDKGVRDGSKISLLDLRLRISNCCSSNSGTWFPLSRARWWGYPSMSSGGKEL